LAKESLNFLSIADIHLNREQSNSMEIDPPGYNAGNDMDYKIFPPLMKLLKDSFSSSEAPKLDFIINFGDMVGHQVPAGISRVKFVTENETKIFQTLLELFPGTPIITIFGNNDSPEKNYGNYTVGKISPYSIAMNSGFKNGFLSTGVMCNRQSLGQSIMPCVIEQNSELGYFSIRLENKLIFIGLNSVIFSPHHKVAGDEVKLQMGFLSKELKLAKQENSSVLIGMHIPAGKNVYDGTVFWNSDYEGDLLTMISNYADQIRGILVAHTHMEEFKIIKMKNKNIGEYFIASLSTSHGNSPAVKSIRITKNRGSWTISNYTAYRIHQPGRQLLFSKYYDFADKYCQNIRFKDNINNCLGNIAFAATLGRFTVNNPYYKDYPAKYPAGFYVNVPAK